jgi:hypothetical protein
VSDRERDAIGDAEYAAWRAGLNPDRVDRDRVTDDVYAGYDRFECADREVSRLQRSQRLREEEMAAIEADVADEIAFDGAAYEEMTGKTLGDK